MRFWTMLAATLFSIEVVHAQQAVPVRTDQELRDAAARAQPGTEIRVAAGEYRGGFELTGLRGAPGRPIVITAADRTNPPVFRGGGSAFHLVDAEHVELRDLVVAGATGNGVNVDDGGTFETPSHHVVLRDLVVRDVGANGNQDGIKLSGVDDFRVEGCTIERWGTDGSAIDLVGCHDGVIEGSTFRHTDGAGGSGVQAKGGSARVVIRRCRFEDAGSRAINLGGSTGRDYFRPPLGSQPYAEATAITVEGNTFLGSDAPIAFVGVDGASVRFNTIWLPRRWAIRVLQETTAPGFVPCRNGEFTRNVVVFRSDRWSEGGVNVGGGTDAASFRFANNFWYCVDAPDRSRPTLPSKELDGTYGRDPSFRDADHGDLRMNADSPARTCGADALPSR